MALVPSAPRSRRAVLAASVGGFAALAAGALGRPAQVRALDPNDVVLGAGNTSTHTTSISNVTNVNDAFQARNTAGGTALSTFAPSNVSILAVSTTNTGITGQSDSWNGVEGRSQTGIGVQGSTNSTAQPAILGRSPGGAIGVYGFSGTLAPPMGPVKVGVYGRATQDATSRGVFGQSTTGRGVQGQATSGRGVHGEATSGLGVRGFATSGVGLSGEASTGYALATKGRVKLEKSAGVSTITSGTNSITVTPGFDVTSGSAVVATLNGDAGGSTSVKRVTVDAAANTFTIILTANASTNVKVAWIILG